MEDTNVSKCNIGKANLVGLVETSRVNKIFNILSIISSPAFTDFCYTFTSPFNQMRTVPSYLAVVNILDHFNHVHDTCETPRQHKRLWQSYATSLRNMIKEFKKIDLSRLFASCWKIHAERRTHFPEKVENKIE